MNDLQIIQTRVFKKGLKARHNPAQRQRLGKTDKQLFEG